MRRVLLLITDLEIGGTPTVVRELATRLSRQWPGCVHVACLGKWGPVADQIRSAGVPVMALGARGPGDWWIIGRLIRLIMREKIDTVLSFLVHANAMAAAASLVCRNARFLQSIQTTQPYPAWHWVVQEIAGQAAGAIIVPSPSVAVAASEWAGVPSEKLRIIPNAIDPAEFAGLARYREKIDRIGFIGRLDPIKRIDDLIMAMTKLPADVTLHIFGQGEHRPVLERLIERLGLGQRVFLRGAVAGPQAALGSIDLLVLPSLAEGFGLVLIEAMAARIPVVATNVPGIRDVVRDGETGLLVPVRNPNALTAAIQRLRDDASLRERLTSAAFKSVQLHFSWEPVLDQYAQALELKEAP